MKQLGAYTDCCFELDFPRIRVAIGVWLLLCLLGCGQRIELPKGCRSEDFLLGPSYFPEDSVIGITISPMPEGTVHSAGNTVYMKQGIVVQAIFPYSTSRRANAEFRENLRDPVFQPVSDWTVPPAATSEANGSGNHRAACGIKGNIPMCRAILQHANFYV